MRLKISHLYFSLAVFKSIIKLFSDYLKTTGVNFIIGVFIEFLKVDAAHGKIMVAILKAKISSRTGLKWYKNTELPQSDFSRCGEGQAHF